MNTVIRFKKDEVKITDVIKFDNITEDILNIWKKEVKQCSWLYNKETDYFVQAFKNRHRIKEFDTELWVISIDDLIIAKIIWIQEFQSEMQLRDIQNLLLSTEKNIDYINNWCKKLNLQTFNLFENE